MRLVRALCIVTSSAALGCGTPHLVLETGNGPGEAALAQQDGVTLVAAANVWGLQELSEVCTPLGLTFDNESGNPLPVNLEAISLVDEQGRVFRPIPPREIARTVFGDVPADAPSGVPAPPKGSGPSAPAAPRAVPPGIPHPEAPESPPAVSPPNAPSAPEAPSEQTSAAPGPLEITLVTQHSFGGSAHPGGSGMSHRSLGPRFGYAYGPHSLGWGWGWGWGWPQYGGFWPLGWWYGPGYYMSTSGPYVVSDGEFATPEQLLQSSLWNTTLASHQRIGGLVYFQPLWQSRLVTLHFTAEPAHAQAIHLAARFAVER